MDTKDFLEFTITAPQGGWLNIASSSPVGGDWRQYWRAWPDDADSAVELITGLAGEQLNVYYSAHLFTERSTEKKYAMPTRTAFVDLDTADTTRLPLKPSLLNLSSDERHQGFWILNEWLDPTQFEALSQRLTYSIPNADHTGWPIGHIMRVPNTLNYKYAPPQRVRVKSHNKLLYVASDFNVLPTLEESARKVFEFDNEWIQQALQLPVGVRNVNELWDSVKDKLARGTDIHFYTEAPDRSVALWRLMSELFRAGLPREHVFLLAYHSKNNKFRYLRYSAERELAKDVLRAENEFLRGPAGIRSRINETRKLANSSPAERKQAIAEQCRNQMESHGTFIHAEGGTLWYILSNEGKPIAISKASTQLDVLLDTMFALNATEPEQQYVVAHLIAYTASLPATGKVATLTYYDPRLNEMLIHTGQRDVVRITPTDIEVVTNGYRDIIFTWTSNSAETITINLEDVPPRPWYDMLFADSMSNLATEGLTPQQCVALLKAWFMLVLMRNAIFTRPILAAFGQPGSGKSTMFNRIYALLYGRTHVIGRITTAEQFDQSMSDMPFFLADNVDSYEKWLPDRIALAAGQSQIIKRKLYTDVDSVTMRSQAMLAITAHNPKFGREDVMDRLIIISFERIADEARVDETSMIRAVLDHRNAIWNDVARDVQRVLAEPEPTRVASLRVQDFAKVGQRVANALGFGDEFFTAVTSLVAQQKGFVLDEDSILVDLFERYCRAKQFPSDEYHPPAKLWGFLDRLAGTNKDFARQYGNSVKLGRKLWAMQDALKQRFDVRWKFDPKLKTRTWRFALKEIGDNGTETDTRVTDES